MTTAIQFLRSFEPSLRPNPVTLAEGMPMINLNECDPGLYFRLRDDSLAKIGPTHVGQMAPNQIPLGYPGNTIGEMWLDTQNRTGDNGRGDVLKVWDGVQWVIVEGDWSCAWSGTNDDWNVVFMNDGHPCGDNDFQWVDPEKTLWARGHVNFGRDCNDEFNVFSTPTFHCGLEINGDLVVNGDLQVNGNANIDGDLNASGALDIGGSAHIGGDLEVDQNILGHGDLELDGNLTIHGESNLEGPTTIGTGDCAVELNVTSTAHFDTCPTTILDATVVDLHVTNNTELDGTLTVHGEVQIDSDTNIDALLVVDELGVQGNAVIGDPGQCGTHILEVNNTQLSNCDILVGGTLPNQPNISIGADGVLEAQFFKGDGSMLFNLPQGLFFKGTYNATTTGPGAPANPQNGDFYINDTDGIVDLSFACAAGDNINEGQLIYFYTQPAPPEGPGDCWVTGSQMDNQGFVTIATDQVIFGQKTFDAELLGNQGATFTGTVTADNLTARADLSVGGETVLEGATTIGTACGPATALLVKSDARFECEVNFDGGIGIGGNLDVGGDLTVDGSVVLGDDCNTDTVVINGLTTMTCPTEFLADATFRQNIAVDGNVTLGNNLPATCADLLTVNSTSTFNCPATFNDSLTINGDFNLGETGNCTETFTVWAQTNIHCSTKIYNSFEVLNAYASYFSGDVGIDGNVRIGDAAGDDLLVNATSQFEAPVSMHDLTSDTTTTLLGLTTIGDPTVPACGTNTLLVGADSTFSCAVRMEGTLDVLENVTIGPDSGCVTQFLVRAESTFTCPTYVQNFFQATRTVELGTSCIDELLVHSTSYFDCLATFNGGIGIGTGDLNVDNNVNIGGNIQIDGNLNTDGNVSIGTDCNTDFEVNSNSVFNCQVELNDDLTVNGNTTLNTLNVNGNSVIGSPNSCNQTLDVWATAVFHCTVSFEQDVEFEQDVNILGGLEVGGDFLLHGSQEIEGNLQVDGDTTLNGSVVIGNNQPTICSDSLLINAQLDQNCDANFHGDVTIDGLLTVDGDFNFNGDLNLGTPGNCDQQLDFWGNSTFHCPAEHQADVNFTNGADLYLGNNLYVQGDQVNQGDLRVNGNVVLGDSQPTACADTFTINSTTDFNCPVEFNDEVDFNGQINANGGIIIGGPGGGPGGDLVVGGDVTLGTLPCGSTTLTVNSETYFRCDVQMDANLNVDGDTTLNNVQVSGNSVLNTLTVNGAADFADTVRFRENVQADKDVNVDGTLDVTGATHLKSTLEVDGDTTLRDNLSVTNNITSVNGVFYGDGSGLVNLNIPSSFRFKGTIDATAANGAPGNPASIDPNPPFVGDTWVNNTAGTVDASWGAPAAGSAIVIDQILFYTTDGEWQLGGIQSIGGFVTIATTETITGAKTFDKTIIATNGLVAPTSTVEALNLTATGPLSVGGTSSLHDTNITGSLTATVDGSFGGDLDVTGNTQLGSGCGTSTLTVDADTTFNCPVTLNNGVNIGSGGGSGSINLGGTINIGTNCNVDVLNVTAVTAFNCNTTHFSNAELRFAQGSNHVGFRAPDLIDASAMWKLPSGEGQPAQVLSTDGAGQLYWKTSEDLWTSIGNTAYRTTYPGRHLIPNQSLDANLGDIDNSLYGERRWHTLWINDIDGLANILMRENAYFGSGCSNVFNVNATATFECDVTMNGDVTMPGGDLTVDGNLEVTGNSSLEGNVEIGTGTPGCSTTLVIDSATTINCTLLVKKATQLEDTLTVAGVSTLNDQLYVNAKSNLRHTVPQSNNTYDLGTATDRWRNVYTNDLHLSNEGSEGNSVDGTTGDWTLQEGADCIFMVNNKTGAKFRVVMEPVS